MKKTPNSLLSKISALTRDKKSRTDSGEFVVEGYKITRDLILKGHQINMVITSTKFLNDPDKKEFAEDIEERGIPQFVCGTNDFGRISSLTSPEGIAAVAAAVPPEPFSNLKNEKFLILCDSVQDPGNMGAIIRNAVAFSADGIIVRGETADIYNPKVVRAASGLMLDIPFFKCEDEGLAELRKKDHRLFAAVSGDDFSCALKDIKISASEGIIVIFGNEGSGVTDDIIDLIDITFNISIDPQAESLNVAAASAISLYEFRRKLNG